MALLAKVEEMLVNTKELTDIDVHDQIDLLRNISVLIYNFQENNDSSISQSRDNSTTDGSGISSFYDHNIELGKSGKLFDLFSSFVLKFEQ